MYRSTYSIARRGIDAGRSHPTDGRTTTKTLNSKWPSRLANAFKITVVGERASSCARSCLCHMTYVCVCVCVCQPSQSFLAPCWSGASKRSRARALLTGGHVPSPVRLSPIVYYINIMMSTSIIVISLLCIAV